MPDYQTVFRDANQLSIPERLRLIDELSASVPDDCPPTLSDAWLEEIARRSAEIDAGTVKTEDWSDIRARALGKRD